MTKFSQVLAGASAVALLASAAHAAPTTVSAKDLDLSTAAGQKELERRAEGAARAACRGTYRPNLNCIPGAKAMIVERAKSGGQVTVVALAHD